MQWLQRAEIWVTSETPRLIFLLHHCSSHVSPTTFSTDMMLPMHHWRGGTMSPAAVLPALQTPCVVGAISWFWNQESGTSIWRQRCVAMVAVVVGRLCPAGACKGTWLLIVVFLLLFGEKWVLWDVWGEVLAVSLIRHGWRMATTTTTSRWWRQQHVWHQKWCPYTVLSSATPLVFNYNNSIKFKITTSW